MIEMGMTIDYGQMVMDNEFARMIKYVVQGIPVNDETLAVDVIHEIGVGKDFLSHENTYKHMRSQSQPQLIDRRTREDWVASGKTDMYERAMEEVRYILENHKPDDGRSALYSGKPQTRSITGWGGRKNSIDRGRI
jgi:trimethylamine--corrinoid protein Co-methyltransferase